MSMTLSPGQVGRIGQKIAEGWAAQAHMTANPSIHDERGWDLFYSFLPTEVRTRSVLSTAPHLTSVA
jgi:hypothetical protein